MTLIRVGRRGWVNAIPSTKNLQLNHRRVRNAFMQIQKVDSQTTNGAVGVQGYIVPDYPYTTFIKGNYSGESYNAIANETPAYFFEFLSPDTGSTAHESMTGNAC